MLGIEYLWIDSLCIIQDDKADWKHEAGTMADVYGGSYLNISATAAADGSRGCFSRGDMHYIIPVPIKVIHYGETRTLFLEDTDLIGTSLSRMPLTMRAWCLQERLLAVRTLHFTNTQLFWDCASLFACETQPDGSLERTYIMNRIDTFSSFLDPWEHVVSDYTDAKLTFSSDRIVALAWIARSQSKRTTESQRYVAGMWIERIVDDL